MSVWTVSSLGDELKLIDVNGGVQTLKRSSIVMMIGSGWILYLGSIFFNSLYYKMHPSGTDISGGALKKRLVCHMENSLDQEAQEMKEKKSMYCPEKSKNLFLNFLSFSAATVKFENEVI